MNAVSIQSGPRDILIAYGEEETRLEIERALAYGNLACREALGGDDAMREIESQPPELLVLDLQLPDQSGLGVCRLLRERPTTARLPIIAISSQATEMDRVLAFESGADDFVARPFYPAELRARVDAVLRGFETPRSGALSSPSEGPVALDAQAGRIRIEGRTVDLTVREFALLKFLAETPGRVVRRRHLIDKIWKGNKPPSERAIDAYVKSIRRKLGTARGMIETVRGVGYRFAELSGAEPAASGDPERNLGDS